MNHPRERGIVANNHHRARVIADDLGWAEDTVVFMTTPADTRGRRFRAVAIDKSITPELRDAVNMLTITTAARCIR